MVRIWYDFRVGLVKVPYSMDLGRFAALMAVFDNDGQVEIVVAHNNLLQTNYGVSVIGDKDKSWRPGRKIWNQHAYNITNDVALV